VFRRGGGGKDWGGGWGYPYREEKRGTKGSYWEKIFPVLKSQIRKLDGKKGESQPSSVEIRNKEMPKSHRMGS